MLQQIRDTGEKMKAYPLFHVFSLGVSSICLPVVSPPAEAASVSEAGGTMCEKTDQIVFSCPLAGGKVVSICAAGGSAQEEGVRFYYAFGRPGAPELVYPDKDAGAGNAFSTSHLVYGKSASGIAYSFANGGYVYIVYWISGAGARDGGVLVQRIGAPRAEAEMKCRPGKITESDNDALMDSVMMWGHDPDIEANGLPDTQ